MDYEKKCLCWFLYLELQGFVWFCLSLFIMIIGILFYLKVVFHLLFVFIKQRFICCQGKVIVWKLETIFCFHHVPLMMFNLYVSDYFKAKWFIRTKTVEDRASFTIFNTTTNTITFYRNFVNCINIFRCSANKSSFWSLFQFCKSKKCMNEISFCLTLVLLNFVFFKVFLT